MTIEQLRYVSAIAKCKSFSEAAKMLYISQPSLSVAVKRLEEELGEPLFVRTNTGVILTSFGNELLSYIQDIVSLYDQMPLHVYGKTKRMVPRLSVANGAFRFFSAAVGKLYFAHKDTGIHIDYHDVSVEQSLAMVADGTVQIGGFIIWSFQKKLMETRLRRSNICFVPMIRCSPTVSIGPRNPLWDRKEDWVTLDMVRGFPLIYSFTEHSNLLLRKLGLYNKGNMITCKERAGRGELLSQTDGISIGSFPLQIYKKTSAYQNQRVFRLEGYDYSSELGYIYNESASLSIIAREFVSYLGELAEN